MEKMKTALSHCEICPRGCGINRTAGKTGWCHAPLLPKVALVSGHLWEEPPISGTKGSGTIFFSHCNLGCVFCQNHTISQEGFGQEVSILRLAEIFLEQQERGFHNINLVSAVQFIPQVAKALEAARAKGLRIPVVYNSNGYESLTGLRMLDGLVDICPILNIGTMTSAFPIPMRRTTGKPPQLPFWKCVGRCRRMFLMQRVSCKRGCFCVI